MRMSRFLCSASWIPTFLGHDTDNCVLVNKLHRLQTTFVDSRHRVDAPHPTLPIGRSVQQRSLEVSIQLGIQFAIVAKENTNCPVCIDGSNLEVCSKRMLHKVSVIGRHLKTIRATDLHQCLEAGIAGDRMRQLLGKFQDVARSMEVGVKECLTAGDLGDMP